MDSDTSGSFDPFASREVAEAQGRKGMTESTCNVVSFNPCFLSTFLSLKVYFNSPLC
jgi:hypothetical protein